MSERWYGLIIIEKIPKRFGGIILEDAASKDSSLLVSRYTYGVREPLFEIPLSDISDGLCCLDESEPQHCDFLRTLIILYKQRISRFEKVYTTPKVQEIIIEDYCSLFSRYSRHTSVNNLAENDLLDCSHLSDDFDNEYDDN